jgi:hypothetical protein
MAKYSLDYGSRLDDFRLFEHELAKLEVDYVQRYLQQAAHDPGTFCYYGVPSSIVPPSITTLSWGEYEAYYGIAFKNSPYSSTVYIRPMLGLARSEQQRSRTVCFAKHQVFQV